MPNVTAGYGRFCYPIAFFGNFSYTVNLFIEKHLIWKQNVSSYGNSFQNKIFVLILFLCIIATLMIKNG